MKIGVVIQARMGSTRLPGKVMKNLVDQSVLAHVIERVKQSELINEIIIATSILEQDDPISAEALNNNVKVFRGSETDVLSRYYLAAKKNELDIIIRVTSDCPLIDPFVLDDMINLFLKNSYDIVSNAGAEASKRTFPRGLDAEMFSYKSLKQAYKLAKEEYQREHVTPYIYENTDNIYYYKNSIDYSNHRWTLDTKEDFDFLTAVYDRLYAGNHNFYMTDIIKLIENEPILYSINSHIEQKKLNK